MPDLRVLLVAEACNPEWVSVPLVAWSQYEALRRRVRVHLCTQIRNRDGLLRAGLREGEDFTAIDSEAVARRVYQLSQFLQGGSGNGWTTGTAMNAVTYPYFEHLLWRQFAPQLRAAEFDIVHRVTPLSPAMPSIIAGRCRRIGVPFVLGPLNGGVPWPAGFDAARRKEGEWLSYMRVAHKLLPGYHAMRRNSSAILVASRVTWGQMPASYRRKCFYMPENAINSNRFHRRRSHRAHRPLKIVFLGRLVPCKGVELLIEAAASLLQSGDLTLEIIGDGQELPELRRLASQLQLGDAVQFPGWIEHSTVQDRLADADLFGFTSIRDFGGAVVLEAMAVGLVPIVLNYGGPGELVTDRTGFLVEMGTRERIIADLRALLQHLVLHPEEIDKRSPAALRRAHEQFSWDIKADQTCAIYRWLLDPTLPRPHFPMPTPDLEVGEPAFVSHGHVIATPPASAALP